MARNKNKNNKEEINSAAKQYFKKYVNLWRPILHNPTTLSGTINDGYAYFCINKENTVWRMIVFIKYMDSLNAILTPIFSSKKSEYNFYSFLQNDCEDLSIFLGKFNGNNWEIYSNSMKNERWPKADLHYPG